MAIRKLGARIRYHYSLKDMRPIDSLNDNKIPILFIYGDKDDLKILLVTRRMWKHFLIVGWLAIRIK